MVRQLLARRLLGLRLKVPYTLSDMAADGAALLDALGIERAHVVGASMGGMIAQLMAVEHGHRVLSLTSIFSTTGHPRLPPAEKRSEEHTSELQSLMRISYAVFCLKKKKTYEDYIINRE